MQFEFSHLLGLEPLTPQSASEKSSPSPPPCHAETVCRPEEESGGERRPFSTVAFPLAWNSQTGSQVPFAAAELDPLVPLAAVSCRNALAIPAPNGTKRQQTAANGTKNVFPEPT